MVKKARALAALQARGSQHRTDQWIFKLPMFARCSPEFVEALIPLMYFEFFQPEQNLLTQGSDTTNFYVIQFGRVETIVEGITVEDAGKGAVFGEQIVVGCHAPSSVTVRATATTLATALKRKDFMEVLNLPPFGAEREVFLEVRQKFLEVQAGEIRTKSENAAASGVAGGRRKSEKMTSAFRIPMLKSCDPGFLQLLDIYMIRRTFFPGEVLIEEGTVGDTCVLINSGRVQVEIGGRQVGELGGGEIVGELAALGISSHRIATVRAIDDCHVAFLHHSTLKAALEAFPAESSRFAALAQRRRSSTVNSPARMLRSMDLFAKSCDGFIDMLASKLEQRVYMVGQLVVVANAESDTIYVLTQGTCSCTLNSTSLNELGPGDVFGEIEISGKASERSAMSVTAKTVCFISLLYRPVVLNALERFPDEMGRFIEAALRKRTDLMQDFSMKAQCDLASYNFFKDCSSEFLDLVKESLERRLFLPGENIVNEGARGDACFILLHGEGEAIHRGAVVATYKQGAIFGELALLGLSTTREATVKATSVCLVEQLRRVDLFEALEVFPQEVHVFQDAVMRHLSGTMQEALHHLPFFSGADARFLTMVVMHVDQAVVMPDMWLAQERHAAKDLLVVINRGVVQMSKEGMAICFLRAGQYFGGTVALGIHHVHHFSFRTKTMCHIFTVDNCTLKTAVQLNSAGREWFASCKKRELEDFKRWQSDVRDQLVKARLKLHMSRHMDKLFPSVRQIIGVENEQTRMRMCFDAWGQVYRHARRKRCVEKALAKATKRGGRHPQRARTIKDYHRHLPDIQGDAQRPFSLTDKPQPPSAYPRKPNPTALGTLKLPAVVPSQDAVMTSPASARGIAGHPNPKKDPWAREVDDVLSCNTEDQVYYGKGPQWHGYHRSSRAEC